MPDQAKSSAEIEDVLSSIRRLVSEHDSVGDKVPAAGERPSPEPGADRLVLTPALRVSDPDDPWVPVSSAATEDEGTRTDEDSAPDVVFPPQDRLVDWAQSGPDASAVSDGFAGARKHASDPSSEAFEPETGDEVLPDLDANGPLQRLAASRAAMSDAVPNPMRNPGQDPPPSEASLPKDGPSADDGGAMPDRLVPDPDAPGDTGTADRPVARKRSEGDGEPIPETDFRDDDHSSDFAGHTKARDAETSAPDAQAQDTAPVADAPEDHAQHHFENDAHAFEPATSDSADDASAPADPSSAPDPDEVSERPMMPIFSRRKFGAARPHDTTLEAEVDTDMPRDEIEDLGDDPNPFTFPDDEDDILDEDTLRELIVDIVREELQGALGQRITRNVRKMVRREIRIALAAEDLD